MYRSPVVDAGARRYVGGPGPSRLNLAASSLPTRRDVAGWSRFRFRRRRVPTRERLQGKSSAMSHRNDPTDVPYAQPMAARSHPAISTVATHHVTVVNIEQDPGIPKGPYASTRTRSRRMLRAAGVLLGSTVLQLRRQYSELARESSSVNPMTYLDCVCAGEFCELWARSRGRRRPLLSWMSQMSSR